ncbi:MAG: hypothetical protein RBT13_01440 [Bacteroidales bacterium]|jgi:hypothetical protein|nr:hypothetical protein [Bacteroidales bacterium]
MKGWTYFFLSVLCLLLFSCQKYESQIKGTVSYISLDDTSEYLAKGAVLEKILITDKSEQKISAIKADTNGNFSFEYVTAGQWKINGTFMIDDVMYKGSSELIETNGEDIKHVDLILHFTKNIANE